MAYDLHPVKAPRAAGFMLRALVGLAEMSGPDSLLTRTLFKNAGILDLRATPVGDEPGVFDLPLHTSTTSARGAHTPLERLLERADASPFTSVGDLHRAFREGKANPSDVAERALQTLAVTKDLRAMIACDPERVRSQARASAERYREGRPLGPLDGVPVAVKDEMDVEGYPTTVGTSFLGKTPASADCEAVRRVRAAGGVILGKANMHEIGIGVTGMNAAHGATRNPYDPDRCTGGSSSGSATAVASGLCPVAIGVDGGGSVRIPAALCGLVGLKTTTGRVSSRGEAPLDWSLATMGPLAATVRDAAILYSILAGPDPWDARTVTQPPVDLDGLLDADLAGIRVGVYDPWFDDAEPAVVAACRRALDALVRAGAEIVPIEIPELALFRSVHVLTILSEMATCHLHLGAGHTAEYGLETRLNLAIARAFTARDYLHAQRHRVRIARSWASILDKVDAIATPTTAMVAPRHPLDALPDGESDITKTTAIMRFAQPSNLLGIPGVSVPAGYDDDGIPIGFQLMGRAWEEALLLRLAAVVEASVPARRPRVYHPLLSGGPT